MLTLLVCKPNNALLLNCINQISFNVKNQIYGDNGLLPTGPLLMGSKYNNNFDEFDMINGWNCVIYKNVKILEFYPEYRDEVKKLNKIYWVDLWREKKIYLIKDTEKFNNYTNRIVDPFSNYFFY